MISELEMFTGNEMNENEMNENEMNENEMVKDILTKFNSFF